MSRRSDRGRPVSDKAFREAERVLNLHPLQQRHHPSAVPADHGKLDHINTHGPLPEFYLDQPFVCRTCGRREIWRAADQKWYFEEAKGHIAQELWSAVHVDRRERSVMRMSRTGPERSARPVSARTLPTTANAGLLSIPQTARLPRRQCLAHQTRPGCADAQTFPTNPSSNGTRGTMRDELRGWLRLPARRTS